MEIGTHCSLKECNALDFLPFKCPSCDGSYCETHMSYEAHKCSRKNDGGVQRRGVVCCPLCNTPIPYGANDQESERVDVKVSRHIDNDCGSERALDKRSDLNRCVAKGCKKKDLVSIKCQKCRRTVCIKHRNYEDHQCGTASSSSNNNKDHKNITSYHPNNPRNLFLNNNTNRQGNTSSPRNTSTNNNHFTSSAPLAHHNAGMSESEALQAALSLSANSNNSSHQTGDDAESRRKQEELDFQLALMMQNESAASSDQINANASSNSQQRGHSNSQRRVTTGSDAPNNGCALM